ncbi:peptidoglycan DD-metalloendopeptidase family protein [Synechococcus sp. W60.1]|uniref:murein hydrolase activator EnvC family protein n=1 Tax=Synechococcus sp. W60.1 TaxID=2964516 RepID=UPI0039C0DA3C
MTSLSRGARRLKVWVMLGLLTLLLLGGLGGGVPSQAQNVNQLQQRQQQIQHQIQSTQRRLGELRQAEEEARRRMGSLQQNIRQTESSLRDNQYRLEQAQKALEQAQKELQELEDRLRRQQQGTAARLRYMQRQGAEHWWALLLTSRDLNEFFDRRHQLQLLIEADRQLIQELQAMAKEVDQQRIALEMQRNEISLILQELAAQKNQLQQQAVAQEQLLSRLANERAAYEAAQRRLEADSQQLTLLIQQLIAQQAQQQGGRDPVQGTGRFIAPVRGPITSGFGWRVHPIYRSRRFHAGIDFGVPTGTAVRASDRGTVIYAGWYGGYGYTVIVNHGGGITTLYAHNSRVAVGVGQQVQRGQVVAASGSTGLSTGPHVHFEVRVNGQPVDPRRYL